MHNELRSEFPDLPIQFLGVNEVGRESGNSLMTEGRTTPLLQDVDADNNGVSDVTYDLWDVTYRDVKILNQENEIVGTVNLTPPAGFDLGDQVNYDALKQILSDVAHERPFWQNPDEPTDVNGDQTTTALDLLTCINELSFGTVSGDSSELPLPMPPAMPIPYLDVSGDGLITAIDALRVINYLSEPSNSAEGEFIVASHESPSATGESEAVMITDGYLDESNRTSFDGNDSEGLELAPTVPTALAKISDAGGEHWQDDRQALDDATPALSGDAVDQVFESGDAISLTDSITNSLIDHESAA